MYLRYKADLISTRTIPSHDGKTRVKFTKIDILHLCDYELENMKTITEKLVENNASLDSDNSKLVSQLTEVLSILSKSDALTIFRMAGDGIKSEIDTPTKIGLTKKQYYTRLKQLVDLGLITKRNESYIQTAFGKVVYQKHIIGLTNNIKNSKYLQMVDVLKSDPKFNDKDIMEFMAKVEPQISHDLSETSGKISMITTEYDDMVRKILEVVEFAQKDILLVTRFQNELIINAVLKKANAGINVRVLADINLVENYFEMQVMKSDKNKSERETVVSNPYYPSKIDRRYVQVPFCAIIADKRHVGLEIVDLNELKKFKMAIFADDAILADSISNVFDGLWEKSSKNHPKIVQNQPKIK